MKRPDFFIIGAPKCGTTSMADWLREHPEIFVSTPKEPGYFSTDIDETRYGSLAAYERLFAEANESHRAVGEASTHYLWSAVAVPKIEEYNPQARYICMLRSPISMVRSVHAHNLRNAREDIRDFGEAWGAQEDRRAGQRIPRSCPSPHILQYGEICQLGEQVERLFAIVPRERVHIIFFSDLKDRPAQTYRGVTDFLGVGGHQPRTFRVSNARSEARFPLLMRLLNHVTRARIRLGLRPTGLRASGPLAALRKRNLKPGDRPSPLDPSVREELVAYFRDDIDHLARVTGRDLNSWLQPPR